MENAPGTPWSVAVAECAPSARTRQRSDPDGSATCAPTPPGKGEDNVTDLNSRIVQNVAAALFIEGVDGHIVFLNPALEKMLGYQAHELLGRHWSVIVPDEEVQPLAERTARRPQGIAEQYETRLRTKDGREIPVLVSAQPLFDEGRFTGVLSTFIDITERKQAAQERERLIEDLDAFAHTVAHDLKTPLSVALGYAELLEEHDDSMSVEERRRYLQFIRQSLTKMVGIVNELLLLATVRRISPEMLRPLAMAGIVAEALERLAHLIQEREAEIVQPDIWPTAIGYGPWLEEVWVNYISNAVRYGGNPPRVVLGATPKGDSVRFWVRDNGPGLTREEVARLFTPDTRPQVVTQGGHGLGLSIVRRIVEKLGGQVGAESKPGDGSTFWFTLRRIPD